MKLFIYNKFDVKKHCPTGKSYIIRITSNSLLKLDFNNYEDSIELFFDDITDEDSYYAINLDDVTNIRKFVEKAVNNNADEIVIHCDYGERRSPAVAIYIDETYKLNLNLRYKLKDFNTLVLQKLLTK